MCLGQGFVWVGFVNLILGLFVASTGASAWGAGYAVWGAVHAVLIIAGQFLGTISNYLLCLPLGLSHCCCQSGVCWAGKGVPLGGCVTTGRYNNSTKCFFYTPNL